MTNVYLCWMSTTGNSPNARLARQMPRRQWLFKRGPYRHHCLPCQVIQGGYIPNDFCCAQWALPDSGKGQARESHWRPILGELKSCVLHLPEQIPEPFFFQRRHYITGI